jgi:acetyltransferase-like isoleucine patch superfamily enzyme
MLLAKRDAGVPSHIFIGQRTAINECNNLRAAGGDIRIGSHCQIAQFCTLVASNHTTETTEYMTDAPLDISKTSIVIEDDVWIGANSAILPGVTIGRGAVIGAGSVVTRDVAPYSICAGNPARIMRVRTLHA